MFWKWPFGFSLFITGKKVNSQISMFDWISNGIPYHFFFNSFFRFDVFFPSSIESVSLCHFTSTFNKFIAFTFFNGMRKKRRNFSLCQNYKKHTTYCIFLLTCLYASLYVEIWGFGVHTWLILWLLFFYSHFSFICTAFRNECNMCARTRTMHIHFAVYELNWIAY